MKRLPDAQFEVMMAVWAEAPPVTTPALMKRLGETRGWKAPALITLLTRLIERGFLRTEKDGKERKYYPLIEREAYLRFETQSFLRRVHGDSLPSLMAAMSGGKRLTDSEIRELKEWARGLGERDG